MVGGGVALMKVWLPAACGIAAGEPNDLDDAEPADGVMSGDLLWLYLRVLATADFDGTAAVIADELWRQLSISLSSRRPWQDRWLRNPL